MKVLVACEFTGTVRRAFRQAGHEAWSVDLRPSEDGSKYHYQEDVIESLYESAKWDDMDLMIAHPPCTYLCNSGVRWLYEKEKRWQKMIEGSVFFRKLMNFEHIPKIAVENPVMHKWARKIISRGPDFTIQPWQFGHKEKKRTCFWTKNLPDLEPTNIVDDPEAKVHKMPPGEERSKKRSRFFKGIAEAMSEQWT